MMDFGGMLTTPPLEIEEVEGKVKEHQPDVLVSHLTELFEMD